MILSKSRDERILGLMQQLAPLKVELTNDSHKHAGHTQHLGSAGFTGDTHYKIVIISSEFSGLSRIDRQRKVLDLLKDEFKSGLHAFEIKALSPEET